jgi:hypothetical protein
MNKTLRYSAYVAFLMSSTSVAVAAGSDTTGQFTIGGGILGYESTQSGADTNDLVINGSASVGVKLAPAWSAQFDVAGEQVAAGHDIDEDQYHTSQAVGGHLTWRKPGTGTVGIFTGFGSSSNTDHDVTYGSWIGLEGQLFFNDVTIYGQAALLNISDGNNDGLVDSASMVRGVGRYFFSKDMKVEVELARIEADDIFGGGEGSGDGEATEWAVSLQGRLADAPIYGTVAYRGGEYEEGGEGEQADLNSLIVGITFMFGTESLKQNDRDGTSLDTSLMPARATTIIDEIN